MAIRDIELYVNEHGALIGDENMLDVFLEYTVASIFRNEEGYKNYPYNSSRNGISNFSVLNNITQNCY